MPRLFLLVALFGLTAPAFAQSNDSLVVLWLSEPGVRPAQLLNSIGNDTDRRFDLTGDGLAELIMQRDDSEGNLQDLRAKSWVNDSLPPINILGVQQILNLNGKRLASAKGEAFEFWGFADADGDGFREAVFFNDFEVALIDPRAPQTVNWRSSFSDLGLPAELRLLGAADLTGDGIEEVVIALPDARQVALFGPKAVNTAGR